MIDTTDPAGHQTADQSANLNSLELLPLLGVLIFVILIYSPIMMNAFNGDDFVHLKWLSEAVKQPELIWRNFHSAWLDISTAKFYRPLISLFMLGDYIIWHGNGTGFHLTNVLCHIANTYFLWLILRQLPLNNDSSKWNYMWCLSAATLFGLHPLHPEAVSWITGRVDTFVTLFSLASLYSYIEWRRSKSGMAQSSNQWFFLSLISMALALMCKEMAIVLPAIFSAYEFTIGSKELKIRKRLLSVFERTFLFWSLLGLYFILRYFALGTLIGGYDNALLSLDNLPELISIWRKSLYLLFFPFDGALLSRSGLITFIWGGLLTANFILIAKHVFIENKNMSTFVFLLSWLVLSLVPVYKLFNIATDLQGSRLAYLSTVPLSALLCFGYATCLEINGKIRYWKLLALALLLSSAGALLLVNNSAWIEAELTSQAIVNQLNDLSKTINKKNTIYIVGLPDQINGAYVCRNALDGMSKYPQISKSIDYCFNLDEINHVFPFGYARHSMTHIDKDRVTSKFYIWDAIEKKLKSFSLPDKASDGSLTIDTNKDISQQEGEIIIDLRNKPCFYLDCLVVSVNFGQAGDKKKGANVCRLFYTNEIVSQFDNAHRLDVHLEPGSGNQKLLFPLHGQADWAMGNRAHLLKLVLPKSRAFYIQDISFEPIEKIMPNLYFRANANQNNLGFIELNDLYPSCQLGFDGGKVVGADKVMFELTAPDQTFTVVNDTKEPNSIFSSKKLKGQTGLISLNKKDFALPGIYELRLRALDSSDKQIGVAGDHIVITVK